MNDGGDPETIKDQIKQVSERAGERLVTMI